MTARLLARRGALAAGQPVAGPEFITLADLWDPVTDVTSESFTITASGSKLSYTGETLTYWDEPGAFNPQGNLWQPYNGADHTQGCRNVTTALTNNSQPISSKQTIRFVIDGGGKFGVRMATNSAAHYTVRITSGGRLKHVQATPVVDTGTGTRRLNITLPGGTPRETEVWITAATNTIGVTPSNAFRFVGVEHDAGATVTAAPDRFCFLSSGDSYVPACGGNVSPAAVSFKCRTIPSVLENYTGWIDCPEGIGGTGYFCMPGTSGSVALDAITSGGASVVGSDHRRPFIQALIEAHRPLLAIFNGSANDDSRSGGAAAMQARVAAVADFVHSVDPAVSMVCVGPQPWNGIPSNRADNRLGIMAAMAAAANRTVNPSGSDGFIDPTNPAAPWWTGTGNESSGTGFQATIVGDAFGHLNDAGVEFFVGKTMAELGPQQIPTAAVLAAA